MQLIDALIYINHRKLHSKKNPPTDKNISNTFNPFCCLDRVIAKKVAKQFECDMCQGQFACNDHLLKHRGERGNGIQCRNAPSYQDDVDLDLGADLNALVFNIQDGMYSTIIFQKLHLIFCFDTF